MSLFISSELEPSRTILPVFQDVAPPADHEGHPGVLFRQKDRGPGLVDGLDDLSDDLPHDERGQPHGGLVQEEQLRLGHHRPGDGQHLLLPPAERPGELFLPVLQNGKQRVNLLQGLLDLFSIFAARVSPQAQVLVYRELGKELAAFRAERKPKPHDLVRRHALNRPALEIDFPLERLEHARDGTEEGGFAPRRCSPEG